MLQTPPLSADNKAMAGVYPPFEPMIKPATKFNLPLLLITVVILAGIAAGAGYLLGSTITQSQAKKEIAAVTKKYGPQIVYDKYVVEPQKQWQDLVSHSSVNYYISGTVEKNIPALKPADSGNGALRGREITVTGAKGTKMKFFVNEGSATVQIGASSSVPVGWKPYSLTAIAGGDKLFAIVNSPVFQRADAALDSSSLNLRSEWILKIDGQILPSGNETQTNQKKP